MSELRQALIKKTAGLIRTHSLVDGALRLVREGQAVASSATGVFKK